LLASALGCCVDLELGEVGEDVFHVGSRQSKVFDHLTLQVRCQLTECLRKSHTAAVNVDSRDSVAYLNRGLVGLSNGDWAAHSGDSLLLRAVEDELSRWDVGGDLA